MVLFICDSHCQSLTGDDVTTFQLVTSEDFKHFFLSLLLVKLKFGPIGTFDPFVATIHICSFTESYKEWVIISVVPNYEFKHSLRIN